MQPIGIIVKDRDILGGTPVFRGTRVPFQALVDYLEAGQTLDEFLLVHKLTNNQARYCSVGLTNRGRLLSVAHAIRNGKVGAITSFRAYVAERKAYLKKSRW